MDPLAFGVVSHAVAASELPLLDEFLSAVETRLDRPVRPLFCTSYDDIAARMMVGAIDVAWLPPIVFLALELRGMAVPLVTNPRGGEASFVSVLITNETSAIRSSASLPGARIGWVERWSAAGYVIPRVGLWAEGIDARMAFAGERFYGSHEAVVRAVVGGKADVGATYANTDTLGRIVRGAWSRIVGAEESIRIISTWSEIPSDVFAAHSHLSSHDRLTVCNAMLEAAKSPRGRALVRRIFGSDRLSPWALETYEPLRAKVLEAANLGLLDELR